MGMAASQARFLQLTARKTNIEYMGQQINQQRLALANASAGLFEKMLSMVPPTPPSSQDDQYYTQGYRFTDSADDIQKSISWSTVVPPSTSFPADVGNTSITITPVTGVAIAISAAGLSSMAGGGSVTITAGGTIDTHGLASALGVSASSTQLAMGYTEVIKDVTIEHSIYNPDGQYTTVQTKEPALLVFDNLNRLLSFTPLKQPVIDARVASAALPTAPKTVGDGEALTYGGKFNDLAYNDDMNKYEFQKATYDYQVERINQSTRQIQAQDKSLELKMKQLDTEHNAVQTEMDAVQKVLQKNIEGSFKTFA